MSLLVLKTNDVFEELSDENKRLLNDLMFANECLLKLIKFKSYVNFIYNKLKYYLDSHESHKYQDLSNEVEEVLQRRQFKSSNESNVQIDEIETKFNPNLTKFDENNAFNDRSDNLNKIHHKKKIGRPRKVKPNDYQISPKKSSITSANGLKRKRRKRKKLSFSSDLNDENSDLEVRKRKKEPLVCGIDACGEKFKSERTFVEHTRKVHNRPKPFVCRETDCPFAASLRHQLRLHMFVHSDQRPFVCEIDGCDKQFKIENQLKSHQTTVHKINAQYTHCEWPGCDYKTVYGGRHMKVHMTTHTGEKTIPCEWPECGRMFNTKDNLRLHMLTHNTVKKYPCTWPGCSFRTHMAFNLKHHMVKHSQVRPFVCDIGDCGKRFKTISMLKSHKKTHFPVIITTKDFKCEADGCGKAFGTELLLKVHSKTHLPARIGCDWPGCTYITTTNRNLVKHHLVHSGLRKYVCEWPECGKRFKDSCRLKDHFRLHTNERRFACTFPGCAYRCVLKGNLTKHMVKHSK